MHKNFKINFFGASLWLGGEICFVLDLPGSYFVTSPRQIIPWSGRTRVTPVPTGLIKKIITIYPFPFQNYVKWITAIKQKISMLFNVDGPCKLLKDIGNLNIFSTIQWRIHENFHFTVKFSQITLCNTIFVPGFQVLYFNCLCLKPLEKRLHSA